MAIISESFEISSCDDVELGIKRTSSLEYRISFDDSKENKALVFMVGGYGANVNLAFLDFSREFIAKKFSVVAVSVFYHCFCHRTSKDEKYSAKIALTKEDLPILAQALRSLKLPFASLNKNNAKAHYALLNQHLAALKAQGILETDYKEALSFTLLPAKDEYANVGIMAAIDHINALKHLVKIHPEFKALPKLTGGGLMVVIYPYSSLKSRLGILMGLLITQARLCLLWTLFWEGKCNKLKFFTTESISSMEAL